MISVAGYGSLLSEASARETVPGLQNFRLVKVSGYRRVFNKVGIVFISRHGADADSLQIASCSTQADSESSIICSQFECSEDEFLELYEREHRFRWIEVSTELLASATGSELPSLARMCSGFSDTDYRLNKCITPAEYHRRVGQYYQGELWRTDILPFPRYLFFCLQAAATQSKEVVDNFLDTSYLADGVTTVREYVSSTPELANWQQQLASYRYPS